MTGIHRPVFSVWRSFNAWSAPILSGWFKYSVTPTKFSMGTTATSLSKLASLANWKIFAPKYVLPSSIYTDVIRGIIRIKNGFACGVRMTVRRFDTKSHMKEYSSYGFQKHT